MIEARTMAKMSSQGEMPTVYTMEGDSQTGRNGDNPNNEAVAHQVSTPSKGQIVGTMTYHGRNFTPITEGDGTGQELECDFTWYTQHARMFLDDFVGIRREGIDDNVE